jgi:hypothetical protein
VRRAATRQHRRTRPDLELLTSEAESQPALKHIPRFIVIVVDVERRNPVVANLGSPLHEDEVVSRSTNSASR